MHSAASSSRTPLGIVLVIAGAVGLPALRLLVWRSLASGAYHLPPLWGTAATLALTALFLGYYRLCGPRRSIREVARLQLGPIRRGWGWLGVALPALVLVDLCWLALLLHFRGPGASADTADATDQPFGWLLLVAGACVSGPIMEEVVFRGWMLRRLDRQLGPVAAVLLTALLFALAHLSLAGLPSRFIWGCFLAVTVYATRSLWAPILLHAVGNVAPLSIGRILPEDLTLATTSRTWFAALAAAVLLGAVAVLAASAVPVLKGRSRGTA